MDAHSQLLLALLVAGSLALEASGLYPVVLLPGFGCSQLDARLTDAFDSASSAPSCGGGALKGTKGWFRLWNNHTALQEDPALVPCYAELLRLVYDPAAGDYRNVPGVETRVVAFGTTRGFGYGDPAMENFCMEKLVQALEAVGYTEGENLFGAPYDFRYAPAPPGEPNREFSRFLSSLTALVEQASERNGDMPAILVTHSFGGLHADVYLRRSPLAWRRRYIKHFVMVSAGAGGAVPLLRFGGSSSPPADPLSFAGTGRSFAGAFSVLPSPKVFGHAPLVITRARNYSAYDIPEYLRACGFSGGEVARYVATVLPVTLGFGAPAVPMTCVNGVGVPTAEALVYWDGNFGAAEPDEVVYGDGDGTTNIASLLALDTLIGADPEQGYFKSVLIRNTSHGGAISDAFALDRLVGDQPWHGKEAFSLSRVLFPYMMSFLLKGTNIKRLFKWPLRRETALSTHLLAQIPPEVELLDYRRLPSSYCESPAGLVHGEDLKAELIPDLDIFFERLYEYFFAKGLRCIITKWIIEILNVTFMVCAIGFFFLFVDWDALGHLKCGVEALEIGAKPCHLMNVIKNDPLIPFTYVKIITIGSMVILTTYGIINFVKFFVKLRSTLNVRDFYYNSLKVTDLDIQTISWPKVVEKVVLLQKSQQLCVVKDLSEHDIIMRLMRKENYLIGMVNKGVIAFPIACWLPGVGPTVGSRFHGRKSYLMLPKTLEWTLNWCIFQSMFDSKFCVRKDFLTSPSVLKKRLIFVGIAMLFLSPCLVIFPLVYMFLRHAEEFYNHPSTASSRRWSNLSRWILREYNEVEHFFRHRMNNCTLHSLNYLKQFPTPLISIVAKFVSFVSGGLAGILLILGFLGESILEGHVFRRNLFWYTVVFGTIATVSRKVVADELQVIDPEGAMTLVVQHTHYMPKRWRGKENSELVRKEFETLFEYTITMLLEEMASIFITPYLLIFVLPKRVNDILCFISEFTVYVDGVGDVCSLSLFDFQRHGNRNYGSPLDSVKDMRSSQGKMEKSLLSFQSTYTSWDPNPDGKQFLCNLQRFREKQIRKYTFQVMEDSQLRSSSRDQSGGKNFHRLLCKDVFPGNGIVYNFSPLGLLDTDQRAYPYILDWYYTCHNERLGRDVDSSTHHDEPGEDIWPPQTLSKPSTEIEEEDIWDSNLYERARSHLEASTSSAFFQRATFKRQGREPNSTSYPWWAQASARRTDPRDSYVEPPHNSFIEPPDFANHYTSGHCSSQHSDWALNTAHPTGPEDSFHEPPNIGNHYVSGYHSSYHSSDVSEGSKELDQRDCRTNSSWTSPQALSKTRYMDDDPDLEQGPSFHFADVTQNNDGNEDKAGGHGVAGICSSMPASLHVRIVPRSSDPI